MAFAALIIFWPAIKNIPLAPLGGDIGGVYSISNLYISNIYGDNVPTHVQNLSKPHTLALEILLHL